MTLDFMEGEVLYGRIPALNRCKEQGVPDEGVCFECNNGVNIRNLLKIADSKFKKGGSKI